MKRMSAILIFSVCTLFSSVVLAGTFEFGGYLTYHTDVAQVAFSLDEDVTNVRLWTDSFDSGANFDPIAALWHADGRLIAQSDDDAWVNPATQTYLDSGFVLSSLDAGDYLFTMATYANFANGTLFEDGFRYDNQTPELMTDWSRGDYWHVVLDGVNDASPAGAPVPEPSTILLLGAGLLGLGIRGRKMIKK